MEHFLNFAQTVSPLGIIALLVIVILQLVNGNGFLQNIFKNQKPQKGILDTISSRLDTIANNHLHELPDMYETLKRIEMKSDKQVEILTQINTKIK